MMKCSKILRIILEKIWSTSKKQQIEALDIDNKKLIDDSKHQKHLYLQKMFKKLKFNHIF